MSKEDELPKNIQLIKYRAMAVEVWEAARSAQTLAMRSEFETLFPTLPKLIQELEETDKAPPPTWQL
jgi:hypothetical protein